jgi:hypothetical protein
MLLSRKVKVNPREDETSFSFVVSNLIHEPTYDALVGLGK